MSATEISIPGSIRSQRTRFAAARKVLEEAVRGRAFPGAAYGVLFDGKVVALDAVGSFTYESGAAAITAETVFDLASLTKVMATTAAAMLLYDRGVLHLDMRLGDILPGFVMGTALGNGKEQVTLRMLLAHSSGLPGYVPLYQEHSTPNHLLRAVFELPLTAAPGARAEYSDIGFILLGKAIEVISGDLPARFCAREIFTPLGLTNTLFCPPEDWRPAIPPTEEDETFRHRVIQGEVHDENCHVLGGCAGHAGLFSNALDVLRFAGCILNEGGGLFRPDTVRMFGTRQENPPGTSRALGWDTPTAPSSSGQHLSARSIGHLGYTGTSLWIDPERRMSVVLLTNRTWPTRENKAIQQVRPLFHDAVAAAIQVK